MLRELLCNLITIYLVVLAARAVLSWFPIRPDSPVASIARVLVVVTEPLLEPLRLRFTGTADGPKTVSSREILPTAAGGVFVLLALLTWFSRRPQNA